jgi:hypothetical protein
VTHEGADVCTKLLHLATVACSCWLWLCHVTLIVNSYTTGTCSMGFFCCCLFFHTTWVMIYIFQAPDGNLHALERRNTCKRGVKSTTTKAVDKSKQQNDLPMNIASRY